SAQPLGEPGQLALALELRAALVLVEGVDLDVDVPAPHVGGGIDGGRRADRVHEGDGVQRGRLGAAGVVDAVDVGQRAEGVLDTVPVRGQVGAHLREGAGWGELDAAADVGQP